MLLNITFKLDPKDKIVSHEYHTLNHDQPKKILEEAVVKRTKEYRAIRELNRRFKKI